MHHNATGTIRLRLTWNRQIGKDKSGTVTRSELFLHMTAGKGYSSEGIRSPLTLLTFSVLKYFFSEEVSGTVYCVVLEIIRCFPEKRFSIPFKDSEIVYASMRLPAW